MRAAHVLRTLPSPLKEALRYLPLPLSKKYLLLVITLHTLLLLLSVVVCFISQYIHLIRFKRSFDWQRYYSAVRLCKKRVIFLGACVGQRWLNCFAALSQS